MFAVLLAAVALGLPSEAQAYNWRTVTVDSAGVVGKYTSIAVDASGDPMISYHDGTPNLDLKFAICDISASANGNCDQTGDWNTTTVDVVDDMGRHTSIATGSNGDPVLSYYDGTNYDLKFAVCDISASANGNCGQSADWSTVTVDSLGTVGEYTSISVDVNGDPIISYREGG